MELNDSSRSQFPAIISLSTTPMVPPTPPPGANRSPPSRQASSSTTATTSSSSSASKALLLLLCLVLLAATAVILLNLQQLQGLQEEEAPRTPNETSSAVLTQEHFSSATSVGTAARIYLHSEDASLVSEILESVEQAPERVKCPALRRCRFKRFDARSDLCSRDGDVRGAIVTLDGAKAEGRGHDCLRGSLQLLPNSDSNTSASAPDFVISYHPNSSLPLHRLEVVEPRRRHPLRHWRRQLARDVNRTRVAAALLDTCTSQSRREDYLRELQDHLQVHLYGECGAPCPGRRRADCLRYLSRFYKFFLVFEPHLCQFYHSGRLFEALEHSSMVPVVFGGVDYASLNLPRSSFVEALDQSPRSLAKYLSHLHAHPDQYAKHLDWRRAGQPRARRWTCDLCKRLLDLGAGNATTKESGDGQEETLRRPRVTEKFWTEKAKCTSWPELDFRP